MESSKRFWENTPCFRLPCTGRKKKLDRLLSTGSFSNWKHSYPADAAIALSVRTERLAFSVPQFRRVKASLGELKPTEEPLATRNKLTNDHDSH